MFFGSAHMFTPSSSTSPEAGFSRPLSSCTKVLLPEPVWPISPVMSPASKEQLTPSSAARSNGVSGLYIYDAFLTSIFAVMN